MRPITKVVELDEKTLARKTYALDFVVLAKQFGVKIEPGVS